MTNVKMLRKGTQAIYILWLIIAAVVVAAVIVIFWMSQTGALYMMAAQVGSLLNFHI